MKIQVARTKVRHHALLALGSVLACARLFAVEPANIHAGPVYFTPTLDTEVRYVDNLFRAENNEVDSWVTELTPKLQAWMQNGLNTYSLRYQLQNSEYFNSHNDDFTDHQFNLDIHQEFNAKNVLNVFGEYYNGHEERGTGLTEGLFAAVVDRPVEYDLATLGADYTLGNRDSNGRVEFAARTRAYRYQNFRDVTRVRDRQEDTYSATFYWKMAPKTDLLAQLRAIDNSYRHGNPDDPAGSLDSAEYNYLLGVSWDATAKTSGSLKAGWYNRNYDSSGRQDADGFQWEIDLGYKPRTYSQVSLKSRRYSRETTGLGDFINTKDASIVWEHYWTSRGKTHLRFMYADDEYTDSPRDDSRTEAELSYSYQLRRWFDVGLGYRRENRDSSLRSLDYDYNVYFLEAEISL